MNQTLISPFEFDKFINKDWNEFFYKLVAEAHNDADDAASSMGGAEVSKVPMMPGSHTKDQKYLSQFHPKMWKQAIKQRYNDDLVDIGKQWDANNMLPPQEANHADEVKFKIPNAKKKAGQPYFRVYTSMDDGAKMYIGHHDLGHALSNPAKAVSNEHEGNPKFGPGPGLKDIDPKDKNSLGEYLKGNQHGLYDFDLSSAVEQTPEFIQQMPDEDIVEMLPGIWKQKYDELPEDQNGRKIISANKYLVDEIKKKRAAMMERPDRTTAGYDVMEQDVANQLIGNWIKATSLGLLGQVPEKTTDPVTGKEVTIEKVPYETAKADFGINPTVGFDPTRTRTKSDDSPEAKKEAKLNKFAPGKIQNLDVYAYRRSVKYYDEDYQGNMIPGSNRVEQILVPYIPDTKTIPKFPLTPEQKATLVHRRRPDLVPKGTPEQMLASYNAALENDKLSKGDKTALRNSASVSGGSERGMDSILNNWDLWNNNQIEHMQKNARTLPEVAKAIHANVKDDPYSNLGGFYALGHSSNKNDLGTPFLGVTKDKRNDFLKKYQPIVVGEVATAVNRWIANQEAGKGGEVQLPQVVVKTLQDLEGDIVTILTYYVLTFMNHRTGGIFDSDERYGLQFKKDQDVMEAGADEHGGTKARNFRKGKIYNQLVSLGQITWNGLPGRRARPNYNLNVGELDKEKGGGSGEGKSTTVGSDISDAGDAGALKKNYRYSWDFRRSANTPTLAKGIARSTWKKDSLTDSSMELEAFMGTLRNRIRRVLGDEVGDVVDKSEKRLQIGIKVAQELYAKFDEQFKKQYPDDEKRHNLVSNMVTKDLMKNLKNGHDDLFGDIGTQESEELITKIKNTILNAGMGYSAPLEQSDPGYKTKLDQSMKTFWMQLINTGSATQPIYNKDAQKFQSTGDPVSIMLLKEPGANPLKPPSAAHIIKVMRIFYPQDMPDEIVKGINNYSLQIYKSVLQRFGIKKSDADMIADLEQVGAKPIQASTTSHPLEQPKPQMAAKNISDLVSQLANVPSNPQLLMTLVPELLTRKQEIEKNPELITRLRDGLPMLGSPTHDQFFQMKQLRRLVQELLAKK